MCDHCDHLTMSLVVSQGEAAANPLDVLVGEHMELAAKYNALVFAVEHRYAPPALGCSVP